MSAESLGKYSGKYVEGNEVPRRNRINLSTPAELAIRNAVDAVEAAGADPLLTDAVNLLQQAREKVADFIDRPPPPAAAPDLGGLFAALAHGDDEHRAWLKGALHDFFAGRPVQKPAGGSRLAAELDKGANSRQKLLAKEWRRLRSHPRDLPGALDKVGDAMANELDTTAPEGGAD